MQNNQFNSAIFLNRFLKYFLIGLVGIVAGIVIALFINKQYTLEAHVVIGKMPGNGAQLIESDVLLIRKLENNDLQQSIINKYPAQANYSSDDKLLTNTLMVFPNKDVGLLTIQFKAQDKQLALKRMQALFLDIKQSHDLIVNNYTQLQLVQKNQLELQLNKINAINLPNQQTNRIDNLATNTNGLKALISLNNTQLYLKQSLDLQNQINAIDNNLKIIELNKTKLLNQPNFLKQIYPSKLIFAVLGMLLALMVYGLLSKAKTFFKFK